MNGPSARRDPKSRAASCASRSAAAGARRRRRVIGAAPSDAPMALDVPDPRERVDEAPTPSEAIFSQAPGARRPRAVAARTDDKI